MPNSVIGRIGGALPAHEMRHYDPRSKQLVAVDWEQLSQPFDKVRGALQQRASAVATPKDFAIPEYTPISQQGRAGTCVANGCSDALEILQGVEYGAQTVQQLSRRWLYYIARQYTGDTAVDNGAYIPAALLQLQNIGTFEEQYFPYFDDPEYIVGDKSRPALDNYTMASNNRISGYYELDVKSPTFLADVETAVRALHPVVYQMNVGPLLQGYQAGQILEPEPNPEGGHCQIITGVRYIAGVRRWWDRNSWGPDFGDNGHVLMSDACMSSATGAWVLTKGLQLVR